MDAWYHGTTAEKLPVLRSQGLRKGSFVSPSVEVARHFAQQRSQFNGHTAVVIKGKGLTGKYRHDRSGRLEGQIKGRCLSFSVVT